MDVLAAQESGLVFKFPICLNFFFSSPSLSLSCNKSAPTLSEHTLSVLTATHSTQLSQTADLWRCSCVSSSSSGGAGRQVKCCVVLCCKCQSICKNDVTSTHSLTLSFPCTPTHPPAPRPRLLKAEPSEEPLKRPDTPTGR